MKEIQRIYRKKNNIVTISCEICEVYSDVKEIMHFSDRCLKNMKIYESMEPQAMELWLQVRSSKLYTFVHWR